MDPVGTLMGHLNSGASAAGSSPEQPTEAAAAFYSNVSCSQDGANAAPEQDGRYVIIN